ncbi:SUKH-4 family immunity protein [Streptomyces cavernicola]|uniref:SUKH-4 family immunity protein n=1 Tax=Streptomyces cavernicola TaxID=3043613 RepID=A0ABT6S8L1_9ACTN|nr:SUKH-4 family immunity protein [Streptomyces sp. B-S-A6]MDI3404435.1 SUKH-4 family immunity protein [Streptomyces sp. B-S-A6]
MSEQMDEAGPGLDLDGVLADPARLLDADRAELRARLAGASAGASAGVGREVFLQAEAMFGVADVSRAEFASWLHFAALATGEPSYAERVAAAEPGMPWRTVWAWWRPVNWFVAQPSLNGDYYWVECFDGDGAELVRVRDHRGEVWLDRGTGQRVPAPTGEVAKACWGSVDGAPNLWDRGELSAPESWAEAEPFASAGGRTRYVWESSHGLAVFETDDEVLRDWPAGDVDTESSQEPPPGPGPSVRRAEGPLTAERMDDAFGAGHVLRIADDALPDALEHPVSRRHLRDVGVPRWWNSHAAEYDGYGPEAMVPPTADELSGADLLTLGSSTYGEVYLHRREGSVHVRGNSEGPSDRTLVTLAPDLDVFTRTLEAVHRYSNACWHPYPAEGDQDDVALLLLDELNDLAPGLFDKGTPSGELWSWIYANITEIGVDGY